MLSHLTTVVPLPTKPITNADKPNYLSSYMLLVVAFVASQPMKEKVATEYPRQESFSEKFVKSMTMYRDLRGIIKERAGLLTECRRRCH